MKYIKTLCILAIFICSCTDDDDGIHQITPPAEEPQDTLPPPPVLSTYKYVEGDTTNGYVYAVWQDSFRWKASGYSLNEDTHTSFPDGYVTVFFENYEPEFGFKRQHLFFSEIPKESVGTYEISGGFWDLDDGMVGSRLFTVMDGGDVSEDAYLVDEDAEDNQLVILEVDTINQIYRGTFTVSFQIRPDTEKKNPDNPDHIKIKDAEFWVKVIE